MVNILTCMLDGLERWQEAGSAHRSSPQWWPASQLWCAGRLRVESQKEDKIQDLTQPCCTHPLDTLLGESMWLVGGKKGCHPVSGRQRSSHPLQGPEKRAFWGCHQISPNQELNCSSVARLSHKEQKMRSECSNLKLRPELVEHLTEMLCAR